jgi:hypothetical protein
VLRYALLKRSRLFDFSVRSRHHLDAIAGANIPLAIVEVFERHGFIWGGKWYHYDSFHFEYRPELIALAKQGKP